MRRLVAVVASGVRLVAGWAGPPTADAAGADPAPQVLGISTTNVVVRRELVRTPGSQSVQVVVRNACGGGYEFQGCSFDPPRPCTTVDVRMRRTAAATSPSARTCGRHIQTFDNAGGKPTPSGSDLDVYLVALGEGWEVHDDGDGLQPLIRNACAGA